ncbi:hypothetical protein DVH24_020545 [Malus domestica]|uniref:Sacsin/Nov domain-containing protein n=1 Tax=Malus domestica TaxID=3750 RepID=A0A498JCU4_MALDO|nr:hypothetical protein DVH24_020545 [Malus domestica]
MKPSAAEKALHSAKLHIEEIRTKKFSIGKTRINPLTLDLHHAVTSLSAELYQKDIHFLMELIQNAEDNEYKKGIEPTLEFVLTKKDITGSGAPATLLVFNNEVGFSRSNIDSICSVGRSTKKGKRHLGFIGEKGIGFKSVFLVSSQPHIFSNGYRIKFREEPNKDCSIGYIVPEWVSGEPTLSSILDVYGATKVVPATTIVLPLKPEKVETVRAQLSGLHPELLLFLSKVNRVYVRGCDPKAANGVSKISICTGTDLMNVRDKTANARVVELSVKEKMGASEEKCKESILLDNVWNLGILECVPSAFVNAFESCVKELSLFPSVGQAFQFIPTQASPIPVFNKLTESIKTRLQGLQIVPCEIFSSERLFFQPKEAVRILHTFRDLLVRIRSKGVVVSGLSSLMKVSHSSLNFQETSGVMDYLGVVYASYNWYAQCIQSCNIVSQVSDDVYIKLLGFIANTCKDTSSIQLLGTMPLLKYINREGNMELRTIPNTTPKIVYSVELEIHTWLSKCNMEFGCLGNFYFLPNSTREALLTHKRSSFLLEWLSSNAGLSPCSATEFVSWLYPYVSNKEPLLPVTLVHFLYHAHMKNIIDDSQLYSFLTVIPLIDGTNQVRMQRTATLVSASRSKWVKLLGPLNPFVGQYYIDIGDVYAKSSMLLGEFVPQDELLHFVVKFSKAVDIPELCPPDVVLQIASHELSREGIFDMMKHILEDISILDLEFYSHRIMLYQDELEFLGVGIRSVDVQRLVTNRFISLASPGMSKEYTFSLLTFITFSKARGMLDMNWLAVMKEKKWLKTHKGYNAPEVSIILPSEIDTQSRLKVTDLPIVDDMGFFVEYS